MYRAANKSTFQLELNTLNIMKDFNSTIARTTFVNLDQSYPPWKGEINSDYDGEKISHDDLYYKVLGTVKPPKKVINPNLYEHYVKQNIRGVHKQGASYDPITNKVIEDSKENDPLF